MYTCEFLHTYFCVLLYTCLTCTVLFPLCLDNETISPFSVIYRCALKKTDIVLLNSTAISLQISLRNYRNSIRIIDFHIKTYATPHPFNHCKVLDSLNIIISCIAVLPLLEQIPFLVNCDPACYFSVSFYFSHPFHLPFLTLFLFFLFSSHEYSNFNLFDYFRHSFILILFYLNCYSLYYCNY